MEKQEITVHLVSGYAGSGVKCNVYIDGVKHVLETGYVVGLIEELMRDRGYTTELAPRQQYKRIIINK